MLLFEVDLRVTICHSNPHTLPIINRPTYENIVQHPTPCENARDQLQMVRAERRRPYLRKRTSLLCMPLESA